MIIGLSHVFRWAFTGLSRDLKMPAQMADSFLNLQFILVRVGRKNDK